jgi:NADPH:quinone reductase-like Zn-dependent oxidoreductase
VLGLYWQGGFLRIIDSEFPLAEAGNAQRRMDADDLTGKILLKP